MGSSSSSLRHATELIITLRLHVGNWPRRRTALMMRFKMQRRRRCCSCHFPLGRLLKFFLLSRMSCIEFDRDASN